MDNLSKKKIDIEIYQMDKNINVHNFLFDLCKSEEEPNVEIKDSAGMFLHSFYNGIENIASTILKDIGEDISKDFQWHTNLLNKIFNSTEDRPAILKDEYKEQLKKYMSFRHRIRHTYSYNVDWDDAKPLVEGSIELWENIKNDIHNFMKIFA